MGKTMARLADGIVTNLEWHPSQAYESTTLVETKDYPVAVGDIFSDGKFYRNGIALMNDNEIVRQDIGILNVKAERSQKALDELITASLEKVNMKNKIKELYPDYISIIGILKAISKEWITAEDAIEIIGEDQYNLALEQDKHRPLTESEALSILLKSEINMISVNDEMALRMKQFYPSWLDHVGEELVELTKWQYNNELYRVKEGKTHVSQNDWTPDITSSLYEKIDETHTGALNDPIPYNGNMTLEENKYYSQDDKIYMCIRNTEISIYNPLEEVVGIYVELVN